MRIRFEQLFWMVPTLLAVLVYFPASEFQYVWDDWYLIGDIARQRETKDWVDSLAASLPFSTNYFRPLVVATFLAEDAFSHSSTLSHCINIALHGVNSALVAVMISLLWAGRFDAKRLHIYGTLAACFFAVQPCLTEGVAWVAGRFDLMAVTFFLLALIVEFRLRDGWPKAALLALLFLLALLCKEMAITLPLVILMLRWAQAGSATEFKAMLQRGGWNVALALVLAFVVYAGIRVGVLGHFVAYESQISEVPLGSALQRVLLVGLAFADYSQMLFFPFVKSGVSRNAVLPVPFDDFQAWAGLTLLLLGIPALVWSMLRSQSVGWRLVFGLLSGVVWLLLPVLQINPSPMLIGSTPTAERVAMMPATLICAILPWLLERMRVATGRTALPVGLMVGAISFNSLLVSVALPAWQNERSLWSYMAHTSPTWALARINLAWEMVYSNPNASLIESGKAVELARQPWQRGTALMMMSMAYDRLHDLPRAVEKMRMAIAAESTGLGQSRYTTQLARMLVANGDLEGAEKELLESIRLSPEIRIDTQITMFEIALARDDISEAEIVAQQLRASMSAANWRNIEKQLKKAKEKKS